MKSNISWWKRTAGLVIVIVIGGVIFYEPFTEKRRERRVREMLLTVQEALQRYHVKEELYPRRTLRGGELVDLLRDFGFIKEGLTNPWTGVEYSAENKVDRMTFKTDELAESYELVVRFLDSEKVRFQLDSTENQSLE